MTTLDAALDQAGYRDDGLPISFGPWANAWCPVWESTALPRAHRAMYFVVDAVSREAQGLAIPHATNVPIRSEA